MYLNVMKIDSVIIRHSPIILLYRMLFMTLGIGILYALYGVLQTQFGGTSLIDNSIHPIVLFFVTIAIEAVAMIVIFLQWAYTTFEIKAHELIFRKGIIRRRRTIHSLKNIQSVEVEQGFPGLLFQYGNIRLYNPLLKEEIYMRSITDPEKYAHALRNALDLDQNTIVPLHNS